VTFAVFTNELLIDLIMTNVVSMLCLMFSMVNKLQSGTKKRSYPSFNFALTSVPISCYNSEIMVKIGVHLRKLLQN